MNIVKVVLMRHGESQWNQENRFTGWVDVDLSKKGCNEAQYAGKLLKKNNFFFDYGYTSVLKRAIHTLWIILDQLDQAWLPITKSWYLNERHYGALQGLNKNEVVTQYGYEKVQQWRRSLHVVPPKIDNVNNKFCGTNDVRYANVNNSILPNGESLLLTINRVVPYWNQVVVPHIRNNESVIVVAHGNSIRAIIQYLNNLNESEISTVEIPTGIPWVHEFTQKVHLVRNFYLY